MPRRLSAILLLCAALGLATACSDEGAKPEPPAPKPTPAKTEPEPAGPATTPDETPAPAKAQEPADLVARGRSVYAANCTACHNPDPHLDGGLGPAIAGSSLELVRLRVLEAKYPDGYQPKRDTKLMIALPHLSGDIEALHAFLNQ